MTRVHYIDIVSAVNIVAAWAGWLPPLAAALSIIWIGIQIYDRMKKR